MAKFYFKYDRTDAFEFLTTFYERVDVTFKLNKLYPSESYIILNDTRDRDIFMNLNEKLLNIKGFSQPVYVPNWKNIKHQGPYFSPIDSIYSQSILILHDKKHLKQFKLSPEEKKYAFLYASALIDQEITVIDDVFKNNFWLSFQEKLNRPHPFDSLNEIDWANVIKKYKDENQNRKILSSFELDKKMLHSAVIVDGTTYSAMPFAVSEESIFYGDDTEYDDKRGTIKRRITPADVILNLSPQFIDYILNAKDFKEIVYQPGVKWAAKWQDPITKKFKYMDIIFTAKKPDDSSDYSNFESESESELENLKNDADDSDNEIDYADTDDTDDDLYSEFNDIDNIDNDYNIFNLKNNRQKIQQNVPYTKKKFDEYIIDFNSLDEQDKRLPYSYIVSETEQWEYVYDACKSGFRVVNNLPKVSNKILELVADAAQIALDRSNNLKLNYFIINYATKRESLNFECEEC